MYKAGNGLHLVIYVPYFQTVSYDVLIKQKEKQNNKRKKYRARHKASKVVAKMLENGLRKRWRERREQFEKERELEIKEAEMLANQRREEHARSLEEKAHEIRSISNDQISTNVDYIDTCYHLEESDAGTLNLPSCHTCNCTTTPSNALRKAAYYRDMAEELKKDNRKLRVEMSERIETVRKFWRNSILEEGTRAGKMIMLALRNSNH